MTRTPIQIQAELQQAQESLTTLPAKGDLISEKAGLELANQRLVIQTHDSDPQAAASAKTTLTLNLDRIKTIESNLAAVYRIESQIDQLKLEMKMSQAEERQAIIKSANSKLDAAITAYQEAAKTAVRQYERMMLQSQSNSRMKGAKVIPHNDRLTMLHIGMFSPWGYDLTPDTTGQMVRDGSVQFLNAEREERKAA
jgi:hypothetical protein